MDDKIIDRVFSELDNHSSRLVDLSEIVHANAAILGMVSKLVVAIILFIVITSLGTFYNYFTKGPVLYHRQIIPIEKGVVPGDQSRGGS